MQVQLAVTWACGTSIPIVEDRVAPDLLSVKEGIVAAHDTSSSQGVHAIASPYENWPAISG